MGVMNYVSSVSTSMPAFIPALKDGAFCGRNGKGGG